MKWLNWRPVALGAMALGAMLLLQPQPAATQGDYLGVQSCSTAACHQKSTKPGAPAAFPSWSQDPHSVAFAGGDSKKGKKDGLTGDKSKKIAAALKIADPTKDAKCLTCHAGSVGPNGVAVKLPLPETGKASLEDGVQCESCHGPGAKYKDIHQKDHAGAVKAGMFDLLAPGAAGKQCKACHGQPIDKALLAAGHPDQSKFNLGSYADGIKHWGGTLGPDGTYIPKK